MSIGERIFGFVVMLLVIGLCIGIGVSLRHNRDLIGKRGQVVMVIEGKPKLVDIVVIALDTDTTPPTFIVRLPDGSESHVTSFTTRPLTLESSP